MPTTRIFDLPLSKNQEFNTSSGDMRIFNLWDQEKGEGQQHETGCSQSKDSLLMRLISQHKQIGIPSANGFKQQLLHSCIQEIIKDFALASFGQEDSCRGASAKEDPSWSGWTAGVMRTGSTPQCILSRMAGNGRRIYTFLHTGVLHSRNKEADPR